MTYFVTDRPAELARPSRTPVRMPVLAASGLFQGWGPKF